MHALAARCHVKQNSFLSYGREFETVWGKLNVSLVIECYVLNHKKQINYLQHLQTNHTSGATKLQNFNYKTTTFWLQQCKTNYNFSSKNYKNYYNKLQLFKKKLQLFTTKLQFFFYKTTTKKFKNYKFSNKNYKIWLKCKRFIMEFVNKSRDLSAQIRDLSAYFLTNHFHILRCMVWMQVFSNFVLWLTPLAWNRG